MSGTDKSDSKSLAALFSSAARLKRKNVTTVVKKRQNDSTAIAQSNFDEKLGGADGRVKRCKASGGSGTQDTDCLTLKSASATTMCTKRPSKTIVSTGDASLTHTVHKKQQEFKTYRDRVSDIETKLERIRAQLSKTQRTRRNLRAYNDLIEQEQIWVRELTLLRIDAPDEDDFFGDLCQFLAQNKQTKQQQPVAVAPPRAAPAEIDCVVQLKPSHHALIVTSGAPVFDMNQFRMLRMARADIEQSLEKSLRGTVERSRVERQRALFDSLLAKDMRSQLSLDTIAVPMAFVLSPLGSGVAAPCTKESVEKIRKVLCEWNDAAIDGSAQHKKMIKVTIGKVQESGDGTVMSRKSANRLKVKMKDIRNMENLSILNYVSVKRRKKTRDEVQHENFKQFLSKRVEEKRVSDRPHYEEDGCEHCDEEELHLDPKTGSVSCPSCGASYTDGIDNHKWHAVAHVPHSKFEYLKSGHLVTLLKRFQGKEATVIPRDIINKVALFIANNKYYSLDTMSYIKMKSVLKRCNLNKFYDHAWQLIYIITGKKPIQFSEIQEYEFEAVFDVLEKVYPIYKPNNLENFMFYWHVIGKTAQLLGHAQHIVDMFPLLKDPRKHQQKERIWRQMMNHVGWRYFVTYHDVEARRMVGATGS